MPCPLSFVVPQKAIGPRAREVCHVPHPGGKRVAECFLTLQIYECHHFDTTNQITQSFSSQREQPLAKHHVSKITKTTLEHTPQKAQGYLLNSN